MQGVLDGYAAAAVCALVWSSYSLLSRRFPAVPTSVVTWFCAATAVLSLICHMLLEQTVWPEGWSQWLAVAGLGLMPVGAAFYAWDHGVKHGDLRILGVLAYATPVLSTLALIAAGYADVAKALRCSTGSVKSQTSRGLARLREVLDDAELPGPVHERTTT